VPAFRVEPYLTTPDDYVSAVRYYITEFFFSEQGYASQYIDLHKTWKKIAEEYEKDDSFGNLLRGTGWLDNTVEKVIAGATTPEQKAIMIHDYVKTTVAWDEEVDRFPDNTLRSVLEDKSGSSSEINMLMIAMMKRADLDASPLLISTRKNGLIRQFTPYDQFNDVICVVKIDGKDKFFDATDKTLAYNVLPERCMNGEGLVIKKELAGTWIPITSARSKVIYSADFKLSNEGEMTGKLSISRDGLFSGEMRSSYASLGQDKYLSSLATPNWEFSKSDFQNMTAIKEIPKEAHEVVIREHATTNGDIIYMNPYVAGLEENKFKSEKREYPVNLPTPIDKIYSAKIQIPDGYRVDEVPANKVFVLPEGGGKFIYSITVMGNVINFTSQLSLSKTLFVSDSYAFLREFYSTVIAKQSEQIVLKKGQ